MLKNRPVRRECSTHLLRCAIGRFKLKILEIHVQAGLLFPERYRYV